MNPFLKSARGKLDSGKNVDSSCSNYQPHFQIGPRIPGFNAPPATAAGGGATPGPRTPNPKTPQQQQGPQKSGTSSAARVARNLFGSGKKSSGKGGDPAK